jgi:capsular polysaccharide biosynthesis protein
MSLTITWHNAAQAQKIADAAVTNLGENNAKYFAQLGAAGASVAVIDKPVAYLVGASLREQLDIPIRVLLALLAGIALAFILDYLDTSVRDARDAEELGLRVVGEIPKTK